MATSTTDPTLTGGIKFILLIPENDFVWQEWRSAVQSCSGLIHENVLKKEHWWLGVSVWAFRICQIITHKAFSAEKALQMLSRLKLTWQIIKEQCPDRTKTYANISMPNKLVISDNHDTTVEKSQVWKRWILNKLHRPTIWPTIFYIYSKYFWALPISVQINARVFERVQKNSPLLIQLLAPPFSQGHYHSSKIDYVIL